VVESTVFRVCAMGFVLCCFSTIDLRDRRAWLVGMCRWGCSSPGRQRREELSYPERFLRILERKCSEG